MVSWAGQSSNEASRRPHTDAEKIRAGNPEREKWSTPAFAVATPSWGAESGRVNDSTCLASLNVSAS